MDSPILTIGRLAKATGTKVETIRFYEKRACYPCPRGPRGITARTPLIT
ncbi:MerR family transcriptional regulator [Paraburkholderia strydomiana]